jgi:hypothetical protein
MLGIGGGLACVLKGTSASPAVDASEIERLGVWLEPTQHVSLAERVVFIRRLEQARVRPLASFAISLDNPTGINQYTSGGGRMNEDPTGEWDRLGANPARAQQEKFPGYPGGSGKSSGGSGKSSSADDRLRASLGVPDDTPRASSIKEGDKVRVDQPGHAEHGKIGIVSSSYGGHHDVNRPSSSSKVGGVPRSASVAYMGHFHESNLKKLAADDDAISLANPGGSNQHGGSYADGGKSDAATHKAASEAHDAAAMAHEAAVTGNGTSKDARAATTAAQVATMGAKMSMPRGSYAGYGDGGPALNGALSSADHSANQALFHTDQKNEAASNHFHAAAAEAHKAAAVIHSDIAQQMRSKKSAPAETLVKE